MLRPRVPLTLTLAAALSMFATTVAAQSPEPYIVDVEGRAVRVMTAGFEDLENRGPVVVLESGAGSTLDNWDSVFSALAAFAPVLAYERAGTGESEWDGLPPTPERAVSQLHALLTQLEVPPPYILVGHSWGAVLIRSFAGRYPQEVAGLVYIDPMDFTLTRADELSALAEIGVVDGETALNAMSKAAATFISRLPPAAEAEYDVIDRFTQTPLEERGLLPTAEVPVAVLLGSKYRQPPPRPEGIEFDYEFRDYFDATIRQRVRKMSRWALESPQGLFLLSTTASHYFHGDEPDLAIDAIRRIVDLTATAR